MPGKGVKGEPFPNSGQAPRRHGRFVKTSMYGRISKLCKGRPVKTQAINAGHEGIITGRRVVELPYLGSQLFCKFCQSNLFLVDIKEEIQHGLACTLGIQCRNCELRNYVYTCKKAPLQTRKNTFEINMKVAMAMIDAGVGPTHMNALLSSINVPTLSTPLLRRHEKMVAEGLERAAKKSCLEAAKLEGALTRAAKAAAAIAAQCDHTVTEDTLSTAEEPQSLVSGDEPLLSAVAPQTPMIDKEISQSLVSGDEPLLSAVAPQSPMIDNDEEISQSLVSGDEPLLSAVAPQSPMIDNYKENLPYQDEMDITISLMEDEWCSNDITIPDERCEPILNTTSVRLAGNTASITTDLPQAASPSFRQPMTSTPSSKVHVLMSPRIALPTSPTEITGSADMGWQKRGNGRKYDSLTGNSSLIGALSSKVLATKTMIKSCKQCKIVGGWCNKKNCKRNWTGSAKSMEAAAAVSMLRSETLKEANVKITVLVGDEDSSTAAAIREEFGDECERASDLMHTQKNLRSDLYLVKAMHPLLDVAAITYLVATVGTVVKKNKGNADKLLVSMKNIPEHAFNNHKNCGTWCTYQQAPELYRNKYLTKSLGEVGCELYKEVCRVFEKVIRSVPRLAPCGSTQCNESFNNTVASKAVKSRHYGDTESLVNRVNAATLQWNEGVGYPSLVFKELSLSPGNLKYKMALNRKRKAEAERRKHPDYKRRRKLNYLSRNSKTARQERSEGETYRSGMGLDPPNLEKTVVQTKKKTKPKLWKPPALSTLPRASSNNPCYVYIDLETSGRCHKFSEILQIAAISQEHGQFSTYVRPTRYISAAASNANQLTYKYGNLRYKNSVVATVSLKEALCKFMEFLKKHSEVVLLAHNASFDLRFLAQNLTKQNMIGDFQTTVIGLVDTLGLFRKTFPKKNNPGLANHTQETLSKFLLGKDYTFEAHNAIADVDTLKLMTEKLKLSSRDLMLNSFTSKAYFERFEKSERAQLMEVLADHGLDRAGMLNLVKGGWSLEKLRTLCKEGTEANTVNLLGNMIKCHDTIAKIHKFLIA